MGHVFIIFLAIILIFISAICSGLNVALMSLDLQDLKRRAKLGDKHALQALSVRKQTHLSLASILLANVAVISATSLLLSDFLNGFIAGIVSTLLIVVFGEILPQAFAVKHSLRAIALFAPFLKLVIFVSYPVSKPLEKLLDRLVGGEDRRLHTRHELGLIISDHFGDQSEIDDDEVEIVRNALQLSEKRVGSIMTPIDKVYYITDDEIVDAKKIDEIKLRNFSRIPIINRDRTVCKRFIVLKDLVDIDFDSRSYTLDQIKTHKTKTVGSMTALDTMFRKFIAAKTHLMVVEKQNKIVGIVTVEDLLEEIIGHEIEDESDAEKL